MLPFLFLHTFVLKLEKCCSNYQGDAKYFGLLQLTLPEVYFRLTLKVKTCYNKNQHVMKCVAMPNNSRDTQNIMGSMN